VEQQQTLSLEAAVALLASDAQAPDIARTTAES
jgi:hypothetical protein